MSTKEIGKAHFLRLPESRRRRLGLKPDIDRELLAYRVFFGEPLLDYEREFLARLVDPAFITFIIGPEPGEKKGRPPSTEVAIKRDEIAEYYFFYRALHPRAKHKEEALPDTAKYFGVSTSYVDKALRGTASARRAEMKAAATAFAENLREVQRLARSGLMNDKLAEIYADRALRNELPFTSYDSIERTGRRAPRSTKRAMTKSHGALK